MVNEVTLELINLAVDKEASPAQQAELAEILGKSDEARASFESIQEVVRKLEEDVAEIDPPADLRDEVLAALRQKKESDAVAPLRPTFRRAGVYLRQTPRAVSNPTEVRVMEKSKRKNFIIAFAAAAAVIIAVVVVWAPSFPPQETSGAIGAVQKFSQKQIGAEDVILGSESARQTSKVLYSDYLSDATKLQSIGANLSAYYLNKGEVSNQTQALASHEAALQSRYESNMQAALNQALELASKTANRGDLSAKIANMQQELNNKLDSHGMDQLNNQLSSVIEQLGTTVAFSKNLEGVQAEFQNALQVAERANLNDRDVLAAAQQLGHATEQLNNLALFNVTLNDRAEYLGSLALESHVLDNAQAQLNALFASRTENATELQNAYFNIGAELSNAAANLESAALSNMQEQLGNEHALASMLSNTEGRLNSIQFADKQVGNLALFNQNVLNATHTLDNVQANLQSSAAFNAQAELASIGSHIDNAAQLQSHLLNAKTENKGDLNAIVANNAQLNAKTGNASQLNGITANASQLNAKTGSASQLNAIAANNAQLSAKTGNGSQLNAVTANASQLNAKTGSAAQLNAITANAAQLNGKTGSKIELNSMSFFSRENLGSFQQYLNNLSEAMASKELGAKLSNRQDLANRAGDLANKSEQLNSRSY